MWFNDKDSLDTIHNHLDEKHTPDSIREDAERELRDRGYDDKNIKEMKDSANKNN